MTEDQQELQASFGEGSPTFLEKHHISPSMFVFLVLGTVFILYQVVGSGLALLVTGYGVTARNAGLVRGLTAGSELLFMLIPAFFFAHLASHNVWSFVRYRAASVWITVVGIVGLLALQQVLQVYMYLQDRLPIPESLQPIIEQLKAMIERTYRLLVTARSPVELLGVVLAVAVVPAICEETLFRGVILHSLEKKFSADWAVISTALLFAVFHLDPFAFVPLAALGAYFGFLLIRSQSIVPAMVAHFFNNFTTIVAVYYGVDEKLLPGVSTPQAVPSSVLLFNLVVFGGIFLLTIAFVLRLTHNSQQ